LAEQRFDDLAQLGLCDGPDKVADEKTLLVDDKRFRYTGHTVGTGCPVARIDGARISYAELVQESLGFGIGILVGDAKELHSPHQLAKTLSTTTVPCWPARSMGLPSRAVN
jgi:hypothetical protein